MTIVGTGVKVACLVAYFGAMSLQIVCALAPQQLGLSSLGLPARASLALSVIYFMGAELLCRKPGAKALDNTKHLTISTMGREVCRVTPILANFLRLPLAIPSLQDSFLRSSPFFLFMLLAATLRYSSMHYLGESFSRSLRVRENQTVVNSGPYGLIRHPGYCANGLLHVCSGVVVAGNLLVGLLCLFVFVSAWHIRMQDEEAMLVRGLPKYAAYLKEVRYRLIPGVY